jgi:ADP-heptose:LPS heptosyltransferase
VIRNRVIAARSDSMGDVLLMGPAVRALAEGNEVTLLVGPRGLQAAHMLPGVEDIVCAELPWIDPEPNPVSRADVWMLITRLARIGAREAVIFTSFHQSALPLALLLRMAGVPRVSAISEDYPGSLLDVRHKVPGEMHEVESALSLAAAAGFAPADKDDGRLRILDPGPVPAQVRALGSYIAVQPGASVSARMWPSDRCADLVATLRANGHNVVVTGGTEDVKLTARVAVSGALDLGGRLDLRQLAAVLRDAGALVAPNTGSAHLAAAVGTPVVSLFAPVVSAARWRPWGVSHALLGDQEAACAGTRARTCPVEGHPCLSSVTVSQVARAVNTLASDASSRKGTAA